jgi:uncharacterized membrane protein
VRTFLRSSVWIMPAAGMLLALAVAPVLRKVDAAMGWTLLDYTPNGARTLLGALVAATLSFVVFTFSILLVAVQIASGNLSPRVISSFLNDPKVKMVLASFVFTFTYTATVLGRIEDTVPQLPMLVALVASILSVGAFLFLIDHSARGLRPVAVVDRVAALGQAVIEHVYPRLLGEAREVFAEPAAGALGPPSRIVVHDGTSGVMVAVDMTGLVAAAERAGCVIELVPQVGEFVARGEPLFQLFGPDGAPDEGELRQAVAFEPARTLEQDPTFAFRILVDVAAKALSPGVNDPTTAVQTIHQIHRLLRIVGTRDLSAGRIRDGAGHVRLVYRTPDWDEFVSLAVTEIRLYGAESIQVPRRLVAMIEQLVRVLPPVRATALQEQLRLIERSVRRGYPDPEDRIRAETPDVQGVGGAR